MNSHKLKLRTIYLLLFPLIVFLFYLLFFIGDVGAGCTGRVTCVNSSDPNDIVYGACRTHPGPGGVGFFCADQSGVCPGGFNQLEGGCNSIPIGGGSGGGSTGGPPPPPVCATGEKLCDCGGTGTSSCVPDIGDCSSVCATSTTTGRIVSSCDPFSNPTFPGRETADIIGYSWHVEDHWWYPAGGPQGIYDSHTSNEVIMFVTFPADHRFAGYESNYPPDYDSNPNAFTSWLIQGSKANFLSGLNSTYGEVLRWTGNVGMTTAEQNEKLFDSCGCDSSNNECTCRFNIPDRLKYAQWTQNGSSVISPTRGDWWEYQAVDICYWLGYSPGSPLAGAYPDEGLRRLCDNCRANLNGYSSTNPTWMTDSECHHGFQLSLPSMFKDGTPFEIRALHARLPRGTQQTPYIEPTDFEDEDNFVFQCVNCSYSAPTAPTFRNRSSASDLFIQDGDTRLPADRQLEIAWNTLDPGTSNNSFCSGTTTLEIAENPTGNCTTSFANTSNIIYADNTINSLATSGLVNPASPAHWNGAARLNWGTDYCARLSVENPAFPAETTTLEFSTNNPPTILNAGIQYGNTTPADSDTTYTDPVPTVVNEDEFTCGGSTSTTRTCTKNVTAAQINAGTVAGGTDPTCWIGHNNPSATAPTPVNTNNSAITFYVEYEDVDNLDTFTLKENFRHKLYAIPRSASTGTTSFLETSLPTGSIQIVSGNVSGLGTSYSAWSSGGNILYRTRMVTSPDTDRIRIYYNLEFTNSLATGTYDFYAGLENTLQPILPAFRSGPTGPYLSTGSTTDFLNPYVTRIAEFQIDAEAPDSQIADIEITGANQFDITWEVIDGAGGSGVDPETVLAYCYRNSATSSLTTPANITIEDINGAIAPNPGETVALNPDSVSSPALPIPQNCFGAITGINNPQFLSELLDPANSGQVTGSYTIDSLSEAGSFVATLAGATDLACNPDPTPDTPEEFTVPDSWSTSGLGGGTVYIGEVSGSTFQGSTPFATESIFTEDSSFTTFGPNEVYYSDNTTTNPDYNLDGATETDSFFDLFDVAAEAVCVSPEATGPASISTIGAIGYGYSDNYTLPVDAFPGTTATNWYEYIKEQFESEIETLTTVPTPTTNISELHPICPPDRFIVEVPTNLTLTNVSCNVAGVIFVDGNLTIEGDFTKGASLGTSDSACSFVVNGDITISPDTTTTKSETNPAHTTAGYDIVEGMFIAEGDIQIAADENTVGSEIFTDGLIVRGGLLSFDTTGAPAIGTSISNSRDLGLLNLYQPSVIYTYDPIHSYTDFNYEIFDTLELIREKSEINNNI